MATRRSRLAVKPNILRGGKAAATPAVKPPTPASTPQVQNVAPPVSPKNVEPQKSSVNIDSAHKIEDRPIHVNAKSEDASRKTESLKPSKGDKLPLESECSKNIDSHQDVEVPSIDSTDNSKQAVPEQTLQSNSIIGKTTKTVKVVSETAVEAADKHSEKAAQPRVRSRFPKAKPNIGGDLSRQRRRHPSVGHSDNEDELRKHPPPVQRVVSVPASPTLPVNTPTSDRVPFIPTQIPNNESGKDDSSLPPRRISRVAEKEEVVVKPPPRARKRKLARTDQPPDRSKMTMKDLIYWNPSSNPMKTSEEVKKKKKDTEDVVEDDAAAEVAPETTEEASNKDETDDSVLAPQLKIGPDGEIILNEESLVVDTSPQKFVYDSNSDVIHESESRITSASFRKRTKTKCWKAKDTAKFYKALSCVGTDFSMMSNLFPKRSRAELKNKFKKEERCNKALVDKAIREQMTFDLSMFESDHSESENVEEIAKSTSKNKKTLKKKMSSSKPLPEKLSGPGATFLNENGCRTIEPPDARMDSDDEELEILDHMSKRRTRSGRLPKPVIDLNAAQFQPQNSGRLVSVSINGKQVASTSVSRPPSVVRIPSSGMKSPPPTSEPPSDKSPGFTSLPQPGTSNSGQINVNQLSPGQLVFVQSRQPGGSQVLHVYVVSPSGVLSRSTSHTPPQPSPLAAKPATPGQSLLSPPLQNQSPSTSMTGQQALGFIPSESTVSAQTESDAVSIPMQSASTLGNSETNVEICMENQMNLRTVINQEHIESGSPSVQSKLTVLSSS